MRFLAFCCLLAIISFANPAQTARAVKLARQEAAASSSGTQALRREVWEGHLEVLAVDYLPPRQPETWYTLTMPSQVESSPIHLSLDVSAIEQRALSHLTSGIRVRVTGHMEAGKVQVLDIQVLDDIHQ